MILIIIVLCGLLLEAIAAATAAVSEHSLNDVSYVECASRSSIFTGAHVRKGRDRTPSCSFYYVKIKLTYTGVSIPPALRYPRNKRQKSQENFSTELVRILLSANKQLT